MGATVGKVRKSRMPVNIIRECLNARTVNIIRDSLKPRTDAREGRRTGFYPPPPSSFLQKHQPQTPPPRGTSNNGPNNLSRVKVAHTHTHKPELRRDLVRVASRPECMQLSVFGVCAHTSSFATVLSQTRKRCASALPSPLSRRALNVLRISCA